MYRKGLQIAELFFGHPIEWLLGLQNLAVIGRDATNGSHRDRAKSWRDEILSLPGADVTHGVLNLKADEQLTDIFKIIIRGH